MINLCERTQGLSSVAAYEQLRPPSALPNYLKRGFTIVEEVVLRVSVPDIGCRRGLYSRWSYAARISGCTWGNR